MDADAPAKTVWRPVRERTVKFIISLLGMIDLDVPHLASQLIEGGFFNDPHFDDS